MSLRVGIDTHAAEQDGTGNCTWVRSLVSALLERNDDIDYFLYATDPGHPFYATLAGRPVIRRLWPRNGLLRVSVAMAVVSLVDRLDILHVQYVGPPLHRGHLVNTIHDLAFLRLPDAFSPLLRHRLSWQVPGQARRADAVLTGSQFSADDIATYCRVNPSRVHVIPYGIDSTRFSQQASARAAALLTRLEVKTPYLLCVGRLNHRKQLPAVLRAFEYLCDDGRELSLVVVGPDDFGADSLRAQANTMKHRSRVKIVGVVADDDLPALMAAAVAFVYPSEFEGFGFPPLEAMACGAPVVSSSAGSLGEVLGDAALFVKPDHDAIARAVALVMDDPGERQRLVDAGLLQAARYQWASTAETTAALYQQLAGHGQLAGSIGSSDK